MEMSKFSLTSEIDDIFDNFNNNFEWNSPPYCLICVGANERLSDMQTEITQSIKKLESRVDVLIKDDELLKKDSREQLKTGLNSMIYRFYIDDYHYLLGELIGTLYTVIWKQAKTTLPPTLKCSSKSEFYANLDEGIKEYEQVFHQALIDLKISQVDMESLKIVKDKRNSQCHPHDAWEKVQTQRCPEQFMNCKSILLKYEALILFQ